MKSDKQRGKHVYPALEMLNYIIKGLKLKKKIRLKIWKKILKIRHLSANQPPYVLRSHVFLKTICFLIFTCLSPVFSDMCFKNIDLSPNTLTTKVLIRDKISY